MEPRILVPLRERQIKQVYELLEWAAANEEHLPEEYRHGSPGSNPDHILGIVGVWDILLGAINPQHGVVTLEKLSPEDGDIRLGVITAIEDLRNTLNVADADNKRVLTLLEWMGIPKEKEWLQ